MIVRKTAAVGGLRFLVMVSNRPFQYPVSDWDAVDLWEVYRIRCSQEDLPVDVGDWQGWVAEIAASLPDQGTAELREFSATRDDKIVWMYCGAYQHDGVFQIDVSPELQYLCVREHHRSTVMAHPLPAPRAQPDDVFSNSRVRNFRSTNGVYVHDADRCRKETVSELPRSLVGLRSSTFRSPEAWCGSDTSSSIANPQVDALIDQWYAALNPVRGGNWSDTSSWRRRPHTPAAV